MFDFLSSQVMSCARFYFSSGSGDDFFIPLVIGIVVLLLVVLVFWAVTADMPDARKTRDNNKPLQTLKGAKIVEKKQTQEYGALQYAVDFGAGNRIVLYAFEDGLKNLVVGDIVDLTYRGDTLKSYQFSQQEETGAAE